MRRFTRGAWMAILIVSAARAARAAPASAAIDSETVRLIDAWVQAVHAHAPGRPDGSVAVVRLLTFRNRVDMNAGIGLFFLALEGKPYDTKGSRAAEYVAAAAHGAGMPDAASFLKRAAVLHTDAVIFADWFPAPPDATAPPPGPPREYERIGGVMVHTRDEPVPPLLANSSLVKYKDGDVVGTTPLNWNWAFARSLLDMVIEIHGARDPFVASWYHAVASLFFANHFYGDATDHFFRSAQVLPNDAPNLFDRGCYAEILGLPAQQIFLTGGKPGTFQPNVPALERTNREAERLFRKALDADPSFVEARVHLARLLDAGGWHAEAATELRKPLESKPDGVVGFYAHLFAARLAQQRGALDDAAAQYRDALALFPNAQSALLGLSQVLLLDGDVQAALATLGRLGPQSLAGDADPWWDYALASGRDVNELMQQVWAMAR